MHCNPPHLLADKEYRNSRKPVRPGADLQCSSQSRRCLYRVSSLAHATLHHHHVFFEHFPIFTHKWHGDSDRTPGNACMWTISWNLHFAFASQEGVSYWCAIVNMLLCNLQNPHEAIKNHAKIMQQPRRFKVLIRVAWLHYVI